MLLFGAYFQAGDLFTILVVTLAGVGIGWVAVQGSRGLQAGVGVGLVWLMLFAAIRSLAILGFGNDRSDPAQLSRLTLIPRVVWVALFWFVAILCLWLGARRMLGL